MQEVLSDLQASGMVDWRLQESMALHTYWKIGGPADLMIFPKNKDQLADAVRSFNRHGMPWFVLGKGSNLLVTDKGIRGAVIKLGGDFEQVRFEDNRLIAGGAYSFIKLSVLAGKEGLTGLEFAGGIPGSVGGAVYMNAGAHGSDVSRILIQAEVLLENGTIVRLDKEDLQYAYRHSVLHDRREIVISAEFELSFGDRKEIAGKMAAYKERRLRTQPLHLAVAGSVFRNPDNDYSARLIESAGLKGMRIGGAEVSVLHANFIINTGEATAQDVLDLIEHIQRIIQTKYDIYLQPEVLVVGER